MNATSKVEIEDNFSLKDYNTFGIDAKARWFANVETESQLIEILKIKSTESLFILGGGSNLLLTKDIDSLVLQINLKGIKIVKEDEKFVWVASKSGENWHEFVIWTLNQNFGGLENLSLIPGNVGTTPIQNIGAYGVEIKDVFESCEAIEIKTLQKKTFDLTSCEFDYRESVFKNKLKNQFIITSVTFKLTKKNHQLNTKYGAIETELKNKGIENPTIQEISKAVIAIRESKLPNPKELGNSGSFFKNPIVSRIDFIQILKKYPEMPFYEVNENEVKIPAGWLIEQAGFKGKRYGNTGIHKNQALVLVNYGNAKGIEVWQLAQKIQKEILEKFNIKIETEVNVI